MIFKFVLFILILDFVCGFQTQNDLEGLPEDIIEDSDIAVFDSYYNLTDVEDYPNICDDYSSEECARLWFFEVTKVLFRNKNRSSNVHFNYVTNINSETLKTKYKVQMKMSKGGKKLISKMKKFQWKSFKCPKLRRLFRTLTTTISSTNQSVSNELIKTENKMVFIYNNGIPCFRKKCLPAGESGIVDLFRYEKDYDTLRGFWTSWSNVTGAKIRELFIKRVDLENIGAVENGYTDVGKYILLKEFEEDNFDKTVLKLFENILPLYRELHAYVRYCLAKYYPGRFDKNGPIPAHLFGNVWAQQWTNIFPIIQQCNGKASNDFHEEVNERLSKFTIHKMFEMAEEFYVSIGLHHMTDEFWERSMFEKPSDRVANCHGSAHDFNNKFDFRIKMCTQKNINDFTTIHHEMGHVQYYMAYRHLPYGFRGSANPGFHEAVGDTIALAVKTPDHLHKIGLISRIPKSENFYIDYLMVTALEKVVFLPFALTMDSYIWGVYNGSVPMSKLNEHWWSLRKRFQGIKPPVERTEKDFDPGAKYHIVTGMSYIRYFVSFILQFQFYESMCNISGYEGPLHRCDFYKSKEAGERLFKMIEQGKSQHWRKTLKILTGESNINTNSLLKFFEPLHQWLKDKNRQLNIPIGW